MTFSRRPARSTSDMNRRTPRRAGVPIAAFVALLAACGAKSPLRVPCSVPLEHVPVNVMLVIQHEDFQALTLPDQSTSWMRLTESLERTLPSIERTTCPS